MDDDFPVQPRKQSFFVGDYVEFKSSHKGSIWRVIRTQRDERGLFAHGHIRLRWWHELVLVHDGSPPGMCVRRCELGWDHQLRSPSNPLLTLALAAREARH